MINLIQTRDTNAIDCVVLRGTRDLLPNYHVFMEPATMPSNHCTPNADLDCVILPADPTEARRLTAALHGHTRLDMIANVPPCSTRLSPNVLDIMTPSGDCVFQTLYYTATGIIPCENILRSEKQRLNMHVTRNMNYYTNMWNMQDQDVVTLMHEASTTTSANLYVLSAYASLLHIDPRIWTQDGVIFFGLQTSQSTLCHFGLYTESHSEGDMHIVYLPCENHAHNWQRETHGAQCSSTMHLAFDNGGPWSQWSTVRIAGREYEGSHTSTDGEAMDNSTDSELDQLVIIEQE